MTPSSTHASYQTRPLGNWRMVMSDALHVAQQRNYIQGLYQIDVTDARRRIHAYKTRTGADFSFNAFLVACVAQAIDENKAVQAMRQGKRLIIFDDVDVNILVEHDVEGQKVVSGYIVRAANHKTSQQIHDEIRAAQQQKVTAEAPVVGFPQWVWLAAKMPSFIRRIILRYFANNPFLIRQTGGTVNFTAVGMFGKGGGWGIPISETSLTVTVGGIDETVKCIDSQFCVREMLCITLGFDHDVIDGAPAARFASRMKELIEAAHGLEQLDSLPTPLESVPLSD